MEILVKIGEQDIEFTSIMGAAEWLAERHWTDAVITVPHLMAMGGVAWDAGFLPEAIAREICCAFTNAIGTSTIHALRRRAQNTNNTSAVEICDRVLNGDFVPREVEMMAERVIAGRKSTSYANGRYLVDDGWGKTTRAQDDDGPSVQEATQALLRAYKRATGFDAWLKIGHDVPPTGA